MKASVKPIFEGSILAKARKVIDRRARKSHNVGNPVIAIDADGMEYRFEGGTSEVEKTVRIKAGRLSNVMNRFKHGKTEVPLCEGFCWLYEKDMEEYSAKVKAWIALNSVDNRKTHI